MIDLPSNGISVDSTNIANAHLGLQEVTKMEKEFNDKFGTSHEIHLDSIAHTGATSIEELASKAIAENEAINEIPSGLKINSGKQIPKMILPHI